MIADYHVHTNLTVDARPTVDEYCKKAIAVGIKEICFTNHQEWVSVNDNSYNYALTDSEWNYHFQEVETARKRFPSLILKVGVELGYYEDLEKELKQFIESFPFDYVIGSVHFVDQKFICGEKELYLSEIEVQKRYNEYFRLLKLLATSGLCDCIGHFDLPRKELPRYPYNNYKKHVFDLMNIMKQNNIGFEINTGGLRRPQKEQYPETKTLIEFLKYNLNTITLGSDAHKLEELGYSFEKTTYFLKDLGFNKIATFNKRKRSYHNL